MSRGSRRQADPRLGGPYLGRDAERGGGRRARSERRIAGASASAVLDPPAAAGASAPPAAADPVVPTSPDVPSGLRELRARSLRALRLGPVSVRYRARSLAVAATAVLLLGAACVVHLSLGRTDIPFADVAATLLGFPPDGGTAFAVTQFRAPRVIAAVLVGAALAVAGALTQTVARNPLASPDVLGVTSGASAGAVAVLVVAGGGAGGLSGLAAGVGMPAAAFAAGLAAGLATYLLAFRRRIDGLRLVLVGIGVHGLAEALTTWMLTLGDVTNAAQAVTWMMGSLNARDWAVVAPAGAAALVLLVAALMCGRALVPASFDEDTAVGIGLPVGRVRAVALLLAILLAALATVVAGPIVFVALASPQIARLAARATVPPLVTSALTGALLVVVADALAANLLPLPLPVGVVTAVLGAPYLAFLVLRSQRSALR